jgi:hypothetical protein
MELGQAMMDIVESDTAYKYLDVKVLRTFWSHTIRWVGTHKNVHFWVLLENGYAVGWNESPSRGWSFPMVKLKPEIIEALTK